MGEAHLADIGHQPFGQFVPGRDAPVADGTTMRRASRRSRSARRCAWRRRACCIHASSCQTCGVGIGDDGCGGGRRLGRARQRIGLSAADAQPSGPTMAILVARARRETRDEQLPHAGRIAQPHRMAPRIPGVEIADDGDARAHSAPRRRSARRCTPSIVTTLAPRCVGQFEMPAFVEQMQIEFAEQRPEGIRILGFLHRPRPGDAQQIGFGCCRRGRRTARAARLARAARATCRRRAPAPRPPARRAGRRGRSRPVAVSCGPSTANGSPSVPLASASATPGGRPVTCRSCRS